ncbi:uncharacterized protein LOC130360721 [Hyla sarda]|uniref:uncharacterized protein LOC130360721 n=1 Tax=Hyla sarda TaxID=327740 RepID=UPI0024C2E2CE|nr:uncharacterized protein LOC130360721 [Hyla sarda]
MTAPQGVPRIQLTAVPLEEVRRVREEEGEIDNSKELNSARTEEAQSSSLETPELNVINLTNEPLDEDTLSLLSKGLNFGLKEKFDKVQFKFDLAKSMRDINLYKFFSNKGAQEHNILEGEQPIKIGSLGFFPSEFTNSYRNVVSMLATEFSDSQTEGLVGTQECRKFFKGKESKFSPPIPQGSNLDLFSKAVIRDVKSILYPKPISNLTPAEFTGYEFPEKEGGSNSHKGGSIVIQETIQYEEAVRQLSDRAIYTTLAAVPTFKILNNLRSFLHKYVDKGILSKEKHQRN